MQDINSVVVVGNLTRDCGTDPYGRDFAYTQGGLAIATVSIASNRSRKQGDGSWADEVSYFDVKIFGKTAENLKPYLTKGQKVCVEGVLKQERWQDSKTGGNMSKVVILANQIQLVGGKREHGDGSQQAYYQESKAGKPTGHVPQQFAERQCQQGYANPGFGAVQGQQPVFKEDIPYTDEIPF